MGDGCVTSELLESLVNGTLPPDQRAALVAHLGSCVACNEVVAALLVTTDPLPARQLVSASAFCLVAGQQLGRYVIAGPLGSGGMGTVYRAHDPVLGRDVAIKVLHELAVAGGAQLIDEARVLAKLDHPNVVAVYEVGTHEAHSYLVMSLVEGQTLAQWLRTPRSWRAILARFLDAARGLNAAHQAGVLHGDFKPANVLVDQAGKVRVADFGLGRPLNSLVEGWQTGVGTPAYMAPEVASGQQASADSDQFSFFAALFEALCKVRPYRGSTVTEVAAAMVSGRPLTFPRGRRVPGWLKRSVLRGLGPREGRFSSMQAVINEFEALLSVTRRQKATAVVLAVTLAVLSVGAWAAYLWRTSCVDERALADVWSASVERQVFDAFTRTGLPFAAASFETVRVKLGAYAQGWGAMHQSACEARRFRGQSETLSALQDNIAP